MGAAFYWNEFIADINATIQDGDHVFDAGAGDGHWEKRIQKNVQYTSMDLGVGDDAIDYSHLNIKGDLRNIPLENSSVDVIICIQVLEHVPEPWKVLKEFNRILKKDGFLFMSLPHSVPLHQEPFDFYRYTKHGVEYLLLNNQFYINYIKPQLGNASKIANDLRMSGILLMENKKYFFGYLYKAFARIVELFLKPSEVRLNLFNDTTGYFIKATKQ